jgi:hypothetical protein
MIPHIPLLLRLQRSICLLLNPILIMIPNILLLPRCRARPSTERPLIHRFFIALAAHTDTLQVVEFLRIFVIFWLVVSTPLGCLPLRAHIEGEGKEGRNSVVETSSVRLLLYVGEEKGAAHVPHKVIAHKAL